MVIIIIGERGSLRAQCGVNGLGVQVQFGCASLMCRCQVTRSQGEAWAVAGSSGNGTYLWIWSWMGSLHGERKKKQGRSQLKDLPASRGQVGGRAGANIGN